MCLDGNHERNRERHLEPSGEADPPLEDTLEGDNCLGNSLCEEPALTAGDWYKRERLLDRKWWLFDTKKREPVRDRATEGERPWYEI